MGMVKASVEVADVGVDNKDEVGGTVELLLIPGLGVRRSPRG